MAGVRKFEKTGLKLSQSPFSQRRTASPVSSTGALALSQVPEHLVVVGGGYIGLEMGLVWRRLGAQVTVVEFLDRMTPTMDGEVAAELQKALEKQGMVFRLCEKVTGAETKGPGVALTLEPAAGGAAETLEADVMLVSIGRRPFTEGLGLDDIGIERDAGGFIQVDERFQTSIEGVFAIGDVIPGPMLAHKAEDEGVIAVEMMAGQPGHIDYNTVPGVVYTAPEAASVGRTEEQLGDDGIAYKAGTFPFMANSRARSNGGETGGFVKILTQLPAYNACLRSSRLIGW